jgi:hypothetical protein
VQVLELSSAPPEDHDGQPFAIVRTPIKGEIVATITSKNLLGCHTHFWNGRTVPCTGATCEPCKTGSPFRWHAYVTAYQFIKKAHILFECTATAAEAFIAYARDQSSLRGCCFRATRAASRQNARVNIDTHVYTGKQSDLPPEPDLPAILARLWQIPRQEISIPDNHYTERRLRFLADVNAIAAANDASKKNGDDQ